MNLTDSPAISAVITGPCWHSRHGRYGYATLENGQRVELCGLGESHRSGVQLQVRRDRRGRWKPAVAALAGEGAR